MEQQVISENKLIPFIKKVYDLSASQGLGFLRFNPEPLSDSDVDALIVPAGRIAVWMDYVRGRACKMNVFRDSNTGTLHFNLPWYDHTPEQEAELLRVIAESNPEGSRGGTEAAVTSQPPSSAAQVHPLVGRDLLT